MNSSSILEKITARISDQLKSGFPIGITGKNLKKKGGILVKIPEGMQQEVLNKHLEQKGEEYELKLHREFHK